MSGGTTAGMTVADLDRAVDFYSRVLGFRLVSEIEVTGTDVEELAGVCGARVRVARMRLGDETIELAGHLARRDGTPAARLRAAQVAFVSPSTLAGSALGFSTATMVRDPDGHALRVVAR